MARPNCATCGQPKPEGWYHSYCRDCQRTYQKAYKKGIRKGGKKRNSKYYVLTPEEKLSLYEYQQHKCGICATEKSLEDLHVDHDHGSGEVRGLLCVRCNTGLGYFGDALEHLLSAVHYLENWPNEEKDLQSRSG